MTSLHHWSGFVPVFDIYVHEVIKRVAVGLVFSFLGQPSVFGTVQPLNKYEMDIIRTTNKALGSKRA